MNILSFLRENSPAFVAFLLGGCILAFIPVIRDFHLETAIFVSVIMAFTAAWVGHTENNSYTTKLALIFALQIVLSLPVFLFSLFQVCVSVDGILFQALIPGTTIAFVLALSSFLRSLTSKARRIHTVLVIVFLAIIPPIIALKTLPHLFLFNIIWGWFPGPIYDEAVTIVASLYWHRLFVVLFSSLLMVLSFRTSAVRRFMAAIIALLMILHVFKWNEFGIIQTKSHIESTLGGRVESDNFILVYDIDSISDEELIYWLFWHEFHYSDLQKMLLIEPNEKKITSFLYKDGWQKQIHTGARRTSYVPVWNKLDQLHIDRQTGAAVLRHELVHVILKQNANPLIGASYKIGLTEGVAVAYEDPRYKRMTNAELIVNSSFDPDFEYLNKVFSYFGFYSGRPAVNYAVSGSFIEFILNERYIDEFKCSYRKNSIQACLGAEYLNLFEGWKTHLSTVPVDSAYQTYATALFSRESLFEKKCARIPSVTEIKYNLYLKFTTRGEETEAISILKDLLVLHPQSASLWNMFAYFSIRNNQYEDVSIDSDFIPFDLHDSFLLRLADASFLKGDHDTADNYIQLYKQRSSGNIENQALILRGISPEIDNRSYDSEFWRQFIDLYYKYDSLDGDTLSHLSPTHLNFWMHVVRSQSIIDHQFLKGTLLHINFDQLSRENLLYVADLMLPHKSTAGLYNSDAKIQIYPRVIDLLDSLSSSLIHKEQVKLLQRASDSYRL